jgi:hypothetical protein
MANRTSSFLGVVEVQSGALLLGDPQHLLPNARDGIAGIDLEEIGRVDRSWTAQPVGDRPVLLLGKLPMEGTFPVFGEFDGESLVAVLVDLEPEVESIVS